MGPHDETQVQPEALIAPPRRSKRSMWRLAGASLLVGGLVAGGLTVAQGGQGSVANARSSSGVAAVQVSSTVQTAPAPNARQGFRGGHGPGGSGGPGGMSGPGQGFGPMAGRFGGGFTVSGVSGNTPSRFVPNRTVTTWLLPG